AVLWLFDSGNSALAMGRRGSAAPGDDFRGAAHSPQKRAPGEFSNPHFAQSRLNGAAHWSQNFSPSGFSAPHFEHRIALAPPARGLRSYRACVTSAKILFNSKNSPLVPHERARRPVAVLHTGRCHRSPTSRRCAKEPSVKRRNCKLY